MPAAEPKVTPEIVAKHGLTPEEYERIQKILGREPNFTELGIFSVMWSEHCSYKNSRKELKKFPTTGPNILVKAGEENAGVVDIGDGWAVAFKIESHNHPSAIEPFQGAATGVGGIIRDIFTMGARPEFLLNSLRFGPITGEGKNVAANRRLFTGVIAGIAHYGNCIGVPTIGGEIYFDESFEGNPLVNVFCLGVLRHEQLARGAASGIGNPVFYVGAETGRDGLAGAAFASRELTEESREDRPAVQVGDPFKEKLLLEACLELLATDAVAGIQDMGAAGLTCSTCETASRGGTGVEIDLAKVPKRETGMTPYEILLSESQERMLIIARRGKEDVVRRIFDKWDVPCAEIGRVTGDGMMRVLNNGSTAAEIPAKPLADEAPLYSREAKEPPRTEDARTRRSFWKNSFSACGLRGLRVLCARLSAAICCAIRRSPRRTGSIGSTTTWSAPARSLGRDRTRPFFMCGRRINSSPRRPTAIRSTAGSIRAKAGASRSRKRRVISPAPAPCRSR